MSYNGVGTSAEEGSYRVGISLGVGGGEDILPVSFTLGKKCSELTSLLPHLHEKGMGRRTKHVVLKRAQYDVTDVIHAWHACMQTNIWTFHFIICYFKV